MKPTPFPDAAGFSSKLISEIIRSSTGERDIILDPLSASGTTAVEILRLGRRVVALERNPVTAFFAETLLRPVSLPSLRWAFQDVHDACRESLSQWFATTCPKCGKQGIIKSVHRGNGKPVRIEYSCACSRKRLMKKPDADDRSVDADIPRLEIPFWHPVLHLYSGNASPSRPQDFINRRTVASLSIILHAIEESTVSSARDVLKAAFASALPASDPRESLSPSESIGKRMRMESQREENPWPAFDGAFRKLYEAKKENNRILKDASIGRSFTELASGRASVLILTGEDSGSPADQLPEGSIDGVVCASPSDPSARERLLTAIQAAWLKLDWAEDAATATAAESMSAAFRTIRRTAKPGCSAHIFCGSDGATDLHRLLNLLEKSGLPVEQISYTPASNRRDPRSGYLLRSPVQKTESIPAGKVAESSLRRTLADAARIRFLLHGSKTSADKILHAFYPLLGKEEIASVAKYSIEDLLAQATESIARYRNGKFILHKGRVRSGSGRKIPATWRRIALDAESLAAGDHGEVHFAREILVRRLAREGLTPEDTDAIRAGIRAAEIDRLRKTRTTSLLSALGKALGYPVRARKGSASGILWKTARDRTVEFTLGGKEILVGSRRKDGNISHWGALSFLNLERGIWEWSSNHPQLGMKLSAGLIPLEETPGTGDTSAQPHGASSADWKLKVVQNRKICDRHYLMTVELPKGAELDYRPGQFFHIICDPNAGNARRYPLTLRRPLSIHRAKYPGFDSAALAWASDIPEEVRRGLVDHPSRLDFLYRVVGEGTELLSRIRKGAVLDAIGPCGNGFSIGEEHTAVIVAGGIGIAPLAALAEWLRFCGKDVLVYVGAVEKEMLNLAVTRGAESEDSGREILQAVREESREIGAQILTVCTDDGSAGEKGLVTEMLERGIRGGCVPRESVRLYACGPAGMLRAVAEIAARYSLECEVSLEERMACGIGACYSCTATVMLPDGTTRKKRVCREGPVFQARDIVWKD